MKHNCETLRHEARISENHLRINDLWEKYQGLREPGEPPIVQPSPDTGPYEFCWKVCRKVPGGLCSAFAGHPRLRVAGWCLAYSLWNWTHRREAMDPLTAFADLKSAQRFKGDHHRTTCLYGLQDEGAIYLAIGQRSRGKNIRGQEFFPVGTRLYDKIMLLREVE